MKPTKAQCKLLRALKEHNGSYIGHHTDDDGVIDYVRFSGSLYAPRIRMSVLTFHALQRNGWIASGARTETGGIMGNPGQGIVDRFYEVRWSLSPMGRSVAEEYAC